MNAINMRIIIIVDMNEQRFLEQGRWMPSFSLFGHRQLITHCPIATKGDNSIIKRIQFNPTYPVQKELAEKLSKQLYRLVKYSNQRTKDKEEIILLNLRNMMYYVVLDGDNQTKSYHNIIYLIFKYFGYLVSRESSRKSKRLSNQITLQNLLADIHSIYFSVNQNQVNLNSFGIEKKLLLLLKKGDYEEMISQIRLEYCNIPQNQKEKLQKLDIILSMVLNKLYDSNEKPTLSPDCQEQGKKASKAYIQNLRNKFSKLCSNNNSKKKQIKDIKEDLQFLGQIFFGKESSIQQFCSKGWPLYIMNQSNLSEMVQTGLIKTAINTYIRRTNNLGRASLKQTQFILLLLEGANTHLIYQSLIELIPNFYAHLIGYLFQIIQPNPISNIYNEEYSIDVVRNMLYHGSQISLETLVSCFAVLQQNNGCQKRNEIFEPLLVYHLVVIDIDDKIEINDFLNKVKILMQFKLQRYAYSEMNNLLNHLLKNGVINRQVLLIYAHCSLLFGHVYNYEQLLSYHLQQIYASSSFDIQFLEAYEQLKFQLEESKQTPSKELSIEIIKIEPLLQKYYLYRSIICEKQDSASKYKMVIELMQRTYRSVTFLQFLSDQIENIVWDIKAKTLTSEASNGFQLQKWFFNSVRQFVDHYPQEREARQEILVRVICSMIS